MSVTHPFQNSLTGYKHSFVKSNNTMLPVGKVVCVGKNYLQRADAPAGKIEDVPVLFMKPSCALVPLEQQIRIPDYSPCYYETELAVLIGSKLQCVHHEQVSDGIAGYAIALDLTLKELLDDLKQQGRPWELAKSFDRSCPISPFINPEQIADPTDVNIRLEMNGEICQEASTGLMIRNTFELISLISRYFTLFPGDVVLTGTPAGTGILPPKADLSVTLDNKYSFFTSVT